MLRRQGRPASIPITLAAMFLAASWGATGAPAPPHGEAATVTDASVDLLHDGAEADTAWVPGRGATLASSGARTGSRGVLLEGTSETAASAARDLAVPVGAGHRVILFVQPSGGMPSEATLLDLRDPAGGRVLSLSINASGALRADHGDGPEVIAWPAGWTDRYVLPLDDWTHLEVALRPGGAHVYAGTSLLTTVSLAVDPLVARVSVDVRGDDARLLVDDLFIADHDPMVRTLWDSSDPHQPWAGWDPAVTGPGPFEQVDDPLAREAAPWREAMHLGSTSDDPTRAVIAVYPAVAPPLVAGMEFTTFGGDCSGPTDLLTLVDGSHAPRLGVRCRSERLEALTTSGWQDLGPVDATDRYRAVVLDAQETHYEVLLDGASLGTFPHDGDERLVGLGVGGGDADVWLRRGFLDRSSLVVHEAFEGPSPDVTLAEDGIGASARYVDEPAHAGDGALALAAGPAMAGRSGAAMDLPSARALSVDLAFLVPETAVYNAYPVAGFYRDGERQFEVRLTHGPDLRAAVWTPDWTYGINSPLAAGWNELRVQWDPGVHGLDVTLALNGWSYHTIRPLSLAALPPDEVRLGLAAEEDPGDAVLRPSAGTGRMVVDDLVVRARNHRADAAIETPLDTVEAGLVRLAGQAPGDEPWDGTGYRQVVVSRWPSYQFLEGGRLTPSWEVWWDASDVEPGTYRLRVLQSEGDVWGPSTDVHHYFTVTAPEP